jgi:hypothetical protein
MEWRPDCSMLSGLGYLLNGLLHTLSLMKPLPGGDEMALIESRDGRVAERLARAGITLPQGDTGVFKRLWKDDLQVDASFYQREVQSEATIDRIAANWSWPQCGVLIVADRGDQGYFVIDGWHRVTAAKRHDMVDKLPCMVFQFEETKGEADAFIGINTIRTAVKPADRFRADVNRGYAPAVELDRLFRRTGFHVDRALGPNTIRCLGKIQACQRSDSRTLAAVWERQIAPLCCDRAVPEVLVGGLWHLAVKTGGESLQIKWTKRLLGIGYDDLLKSIRLRNIADRDLPRNQAWATAIMLAANKGMQNKLRMKD